MDHHHRTSPFSPRAFLAVVLFLALSAHVLAQSPPKDLAAQLAAVETQLANPTTAPRIRLQLALDADTLRARLIALQPNDDRVATWFADRAAYQLDLAASTGLDLVCIFGLPTQAQADQVRPFAQAALDLAQQADAAATAATTALELRLLDRTRPPNPAEVAAIESRLTKLVETEQARRIPMLRALARTLLASTSTDPARAAATAQDAVRDLKDVSAPTPALKRSLQIARGAALIHAAFGEHARDVSDLALVQFRDIDLANPAADPDTTLRARLGMARTGLINPPTQPTTPTARLEAEAAAAFLVASSNTNLAARPALIADAVRTLFAASPTAEQIAAGAPDTRILICEKIAAILPKTVPIAALPPEAAFARAVTLARSAKPDDAQSRDEAAGLFALASDRTDATASLRCAARWERAVVLAESGDEFAAIDALARVFTEDVSCAQALTAAQRFAEAFLARNPPGTSMASQWSTRKGVFRIALLLLLERQPNDRWRTEFVRLAATDAAASAKPLGGLPDDFTRATSTAKGITSEAARDAAFATLADALALHLERRRTEVSAMPTPAPGWAALNPSARAALEWMRAHDPQRLPLATLLVGETLAYSGDPGALAVLAPLAGGPIDRPDDPQFIRFRFALAKSQRLNNEHAKAFSTLREAADRLEGAPGTTTRDPAFWAAWAEMLAILQSLNADGSRTEDLRVQIKRLELLDPTLGGPPHAEAIRKIRDSLARPG